MEAKIAHLQMIQEIVNRMSRNSFLIKGWSVTLVSGLFALAAVGSIRWFAFLAYFPSIVFWALDAYFLRQERLFRRLYDRARSLKEADIDFSMDLSIVEDQVARTHEVAFSRTLRWFHGTIVFAVVVVMVLLVATT